VCAFVFVVVMFAFIWAIWRAPRSNADTAPNAVPAPQRDRKISGRVTAALVISSVLLIALFVASVATDRALAQLSLTDALHVRVTAHRWWWEVTYDDPLPERIFATAN